jgi:D-arabinose 1-dehydrogenase-like Zn-dependent alcohol dehydrogenase
LDHHHVVVFGGLVHPEIALNMNMLQDHHILILGLGDSGLAMVRWCVLQGARVTVVDNREHAPGLLALQEEGLSVNVKTQAFTEDLLDDQSVRAVFKSPGLTPAQVAPVWVAAQARGLWVGTELSLFAHALRQLKAASRTARNSLVSKAACTSRASSCSGSFLSAFLIFFRPRSIAMMIE